MSPAATVTHAWLRAAATAGCLLAAGAACAQDDTAFSRAMDSYESNHWRAAYAGFAALADQGHADAARIALLMRRLGPRLYASTFDASSAQVDGWLRTASRALGSPRLATTAGGRD